MVHQVLSRSNHKIIAGVCGGLAHYFGWDPARFRLIYLLVSLFSAGFPGTVLYLILWVLMPAGSKAIENL